MPVRNRDKLLQPRSVAKLILRSPWTRVTPMVRERLTAPDS